MLDMLKYDFYRLTRSRTMLVVFIVAFALSLIIPISNVIAHYSESFLSAMLCNNIFEIILLVFVPILIINDFSSGFLKNTFTRINKFYYILSKIIYIILFILILYIISFGFMAISSLVINGAVFYDQMYDNFSVGGWIINRAFYLGFLIAWSIFIMFMSYLVRKNYVVISAFLVYMQFLAFPIWDILNSINIVMGGQSVQITDGLILPNLQYLSIVTDWNNVWNWGWTIKLILILGYIILFAILSWLLFRRGNFKEDS